MPLRATLDWSYELLSDEEKVIHRRLAAFAGGCTHQAAGALSIDLGREQSELVDLLSRLAAKSLVLVDRSAKRASSEVRDRLTETVDTRGYKGWIVTHGKVMSARHHHLARL